MCRALRALSNNNEARMSLPRAASCDLQEQGTGLDDWRQVGVGLQLDADYVPLQPVQVPLPLRWPRLLSEIDCWQPRDHDGTAAHFSCQAG
jgi:hypothetical protein